MKNKFEKVPQHKKYKNIPLNKDTFVKVDNDDFYRFCNISWYKSTGSSAYIYAYNSNLGFMHRIIMQAPKGMVVDHINGDTLDNRKSNLRICTPQQNKFNSKTRRDSSTGVKGVFKTKYGWFALVKMGSIFKRSKTYCTIQEAEKYYKKYAKELHQEYAKI